MTSRMPVARRALVTMAALVAAAVTAGCQNPPGSVPEPAKPTYAPAATSAPPPAAPDAPAPEPSISYAPDATPQPDGSAQEMSTRRAPDQPAPSSDGPLDERSLPFAVGGFKGFATTPTEGEYNPNGTWVHAVDAVVASSQALPACSAPVTAPPASHALAGTYSTIDGVPGNGLVLEFSSDEDATTWLHAFIDRLESCTPESGTVVTDLERAPASFHGHRTTAVDGATWSEAGRARANRVTLLALAADRVGPLTVDEVLQRH